MTADEIIQILKSAYDAGWYGPLQSVCPIEYQSTEHLIGLWKKAYLAGWYGLLELRDSAVDAIYAEHLIAIAPPPPPPPPPPVEITLANLDQFIQVESATIVGPATITVNWQTG